jgi:hypothetical protein
MPLSGFPVNDTDAANAWLADESNHNFKEWEGTSLEDKKKWAELETSLSAVTGLKSHGIMKNIKDAISDNLSEKTTVRATSEQKHKIAKQAATAILQNTNAGWKDASEKWLVDALTVFAPRAIKLWKKGQNGKGGRSEPDEESQSSISSKKRRLNGKQEGNEESRAKGNDIKIQHTPRNNGHSAKQSQSYKSQHPKGRPPLDLETCMIEVILDDATRVRTPVEMVLNDNKLNCSITDIRAEHLNFEKLLAIVSATDDSWDSQTCELRRGEDDLQIRDGEDFTNAIGVMHFSLEKLCLEKPESK